MDILCNVDEYIDIEFKKISNLRFSAFCIACKKNGISSCKAIEDFFDVYIQDAFGKDANYNEICKDINMYEEIEEY
jgi:hypothetical protein